MFDVLHAVNAQLDIVLSDIIKYFAWNRGIAMWWLLVEQCENQSGSLYDNDH